MRQYVKDTASLEVNELSLLVSFMTSQPPTNFFIDLVSTKIRSSLQFLTDQTVNLNYQVYCSHKRIENSK